MKKIFSILCIGLAFMICSCNGIDKKIQNYEEAMKQNDLTQATDILANINEKELTVAVKKQIREINDEYYNKVVDVYLGNVEKMIKSGDTKGAIEVMVGTDSNDFSQKQLEKIAELTLKFTTEGVELETQKNVADAEGKDKQKNVAIADILGPIAKYVATYNELMGIVKKAAPVTPNNVGEFSGSGSISKYGIGMNLDTTNPKEVSGKYWYTKYGPGNSLKISGVLDGENLSIEEFDQYYQCTGRFNGTFDGKTYSGTWTNPRNGKQMSFKITF